MNKKGVVIPVVLAFQIAFAAATVAAIWHIPAWEQAKANGTEAVYQAQAMWPQQEFAKLGKGNTPPAVESPRGGYWEGKVLGK